jgi:hypothetical protein
MVIRIEQGKGGKDLLDDLPLDAEASEARAPRPH